MPRWPNSKVPARPILERFEEKYLAEPMSGCWLWEAGGVKKGYGTFHIGPRSYHAHRVAWMLYRGPIVPDTLHVLHKCDNPACVNPDHLFLGTNADNMADMAKKGRRKGRLMGSDNPNAKLSAEDVAQIRALRSSGTSVRSLMKQFGMSDSHIYYIINQKAWK